MILLNAEKITKGYTEKNLLSGCSLGIHEGDKIGIIGVNGTGKSTLLKILAGLEMPDSGSVTCASGVRVAYLPQNPVFTEHITVLEQVSQGMTEKTSRTHTADEYECKSILTKLRLLDFDATVDTLSGGQKRRVAIACALASQSEVLILDEPTNHIDSELVDWLETYLSKYRGALIMVTHDRYFLDRVANKIIELTQGDLISYPANYSQYLELKAQREEMLQATQRKRKSLYRKELEWIHQGAKARGTKSRYRIERLEDLENQLGQSEENKLSLGSISSRLGKKIIELESVCKGYQEELLIRDFSYLVLRRDRVGIIGANGCGKSTLLKMIAGSVQPDSGEIIIGDTVKIGYFSQDSAEMDTSLKAIDYIRGVAQEVETPEGMLSASQMMEKFLFPSTLQYTEITRLSGGERRRLFLLRILMDAPNVLLLDEPTNDLDIETLSVLEDYLEGFSGAVLAVSHDRYFLDKVAEHVFVFSQDGTLQHYLGGYSDYRLEYSQEQSPKKTPETTKEKPISSRPKKVKLSYKEQREYEIIDEDIANLEQSIQKAQEEIQRQSSNYEILEQLIANKEALEDALSQKMDRWVYLNDLSAELNDMG